MKTMFVRMRWSRERAYALLEDEYPLSWLKTQGDDELFELGKVLGYWEANQ